MASTLSPTKVEVAEQLKVREEEEMMKVKGKALLESLLLRPSQPPPAAVTTLESPPHPVTPPSEGQQRPTQQLLSPFTPELLEENVEPSSDAASNEAHKATLREIQRSIDECLRKTLALEIQETAAMPAALELAESLTTSQTLIGKLIVAVGPENADDQRHLGMNGDLLIDLGDSFEELSIDIPPNGAQALDGQEKVASSLVMAAPGHPRCSSLIAGGLAVPEPPTPPPSVTPSRDIRRVCSSQLSQWTQELSDPISGFSREALTNNGAGDTRPTTTTLFPNPWSQQDAKIDYDVKVTTGRSEHHWNHQENPTSYYWNNNNRPINHWKNNTGPISHWSHNTKAIDEWTSHGPGEYHLPMITNWELLQQELSPPHLKPLEPFFAATDNLHGIALSPIQRVRRDSDENKHDSSHSDDDTFILL